MGTVTINGKTISTPSGASVSVINDVVYVDGKRVDVSDSKTFNIEVNGNIGNLDVEHANLIKISGDVSGNVKTLSGDVVAHSINGDVDTMSGDISTR